VHADATSAHTFQEARMRKLVVLNNLTLDGVMQGPGRPDEDTRDGFTHGGWSMPYNDAVKGQAMGEGMSRGATLLEGDAADAVARLKQEDGLDLLLMGSGVLAESLRQRGLVDEYILMIHPLVLGTGRRLFADGGMSSLTLVKSVPTTKGVMIATYRATEGAAPQYIAPQGA
jgi:hypothetical protein